jgi:hypothetical protein
MNRRPILYLTMAALALGWCALHAAASGVDPDVSIVAHVFPFGAAPLAAGSPSFQMTLTVGEEGPIHTLQGGDTVLEAGFQATHDGLDTDGDGIPDSVDTDDDGDGVPDNLDARPYDTDGDGLNNIAADDDDDNDGLDDVAEAGFGTSPVKPDTDGDKQTDYDEWVAGTSGTDTNSLFRFARIAVAGGITTRVDWAGVAGRTYELRACTNLCATDWVYLATTSVTANAAASLFDPMGGTAQKTYRLEVWLTPP